MLQITPLSWVRSLYNYAWASPRHFVFCATSDRFTPYQFGKKPIAGPHDSVGNREVEHLQLHGDALLNDLSESLQTEAYKPTDPHWGRYDAWFPTGTIVPCYNYGSLTKLSCALFVLGGHESRSYDYQRPDKPGTVYPLLKEGYRCIYGKLHDVFYYVEVAFSANGNRNYISINYGLQWAAYNNKYKPNTNSSEYLWGAGRAPAFTASGEEFPTPLNIRVMSGSSSTTMYADVRLPEGVTLNEYSKQDPEILARQAESLLEQIYANFKAHLAKYGTAYSRQYDTVASRTGVMPEQKFLSQDLIKFRSDLWESVSRAMPEFDHRVLLGEATHSAANSAKAFEGNGIAYIKEIKALKDTVLDLVKLMKGKKDPKFFANLWLSTRYGLRLTAQDTNSLLTSIKREVELLGRSKATCRGASHDDRTTVNCKLYYKVDRSVDPKNILEKLYKWDLLPTLENIWDLVPYSFVVDWFVNVGDILDGIDSILYTKTMDITNTCYGVKSTWSPTHLDTTLGVFGNVEATYYSRLCPSVPFQYVPTFSGSLPSAINIVDGASLIIQRL